MFTQEDIRELEYLLRCSSLGFEAREGGTMGYMNETWYVFFDYDSTKTKSFEKFHDAIVYLISPSWEKDNGNLYK
jgi:hypothetical protein